MGSGDRAAFFHSTSLYPSVQETMTSNVECPESQKEVLGFENRTLELSRIDLFLLQQMLGFVLFQERKLRENQVGKNDALNSMHYKGDLVTCGRLRRRLPKGKDNFHNI